MVFVSGAGQACFSRGLLCRSDHVFIYVRLNHTAWLISLDVIANAVLITYDLFLFTQLRLDMLFSSVSVTSGDIDKQIRYEMKMGVFWINCVNSVSQPRCACTSGLFWWITALAVTVRSLKNVHLQGALKLKPWIRANTFKPNVDFLHTTHTHLQDL